MKWLWLIVWCMIVYALCLAFVPGYDPLTGLL
jgi:hypothetical protein